MSRFNMGDTDLTEAELAQLQGTPEPDPTPPQEPPAEAVSKESLHTEEPPAPPQDDDDGESLVVDADGRIRAPDGRFKKVVSHRALHAEREEHKKTKAELQAERLARSRESEELRILKLAYGVEEPDQQSTPPAPPAPEKPKPVDLMADPLGAMKQIQDQLFNAQQTQQPNPELQRMQQQVQQLVQQREHEQSMSRFRQEIDTVAATDPDIRAKTQHILEVEEAKLAAQQPRLTPEQRRQMVLVGAANAIRQAQQAGQSPAAIIQAMAKSYNFQPKPTQQPITPTSTPATPDPVTQRIENINRGQRAAASFSGIAGQTGDHVETARQLAAMDEDDYTRAVGKMDRKEYERRFLGR